jgi:hypothetical protein
MSEQMSGVSQACRTFLEEAPRHANASDGEQQVVSFGA